MSKKIIYTIMSLISFFGFIDIGLKALFWYDYPLHLCDGTNLDIITANFNCYFSLSLSIICFILFIFFTYKAKKNKNIK